MARAKFKVLTAVTMKNAVLTCPDDGGSRFLYVGVLIIP